MRVDFFFFKEKTEHLKMIEHENKNVNEDISDKKNPHNEDMFLSVGYPKNYVFLLLSYELLIDTFKTVK